MSTSDKRSNYNLSENKGTCLRCKRHRRLILHPSIKKRLCIKCATLPDVICDSCGESMPAGRGSHCEECYWHDLTIRKIGINQFLFESPEIQKAFYQYGLWLVSNLKPNAASQKITKHVWFFKDMDSIWSSVPAYSELLNHYGAEGLRRARLPMRWLSETKRVNIDKHAKLSHSEYLRIEKMMNSIVDASDYANEAVSFKEKMLSRVKLKEIKIRTARMALSSMCSFLRFIDQKKMDINQETLNSYLLRKPGQRASLWSFASFLNLESGYRLNIPTNKSSITKKRVVLEKQIVELYSKEKLNLQERELWVRVCLEYFHKFKLGQRQTELNLEGYYENANDKYWIPFKL